MRYRLGDLRRFVQGFDFFIEARQHHLACLKAQDSHSVCDILFLYCGIYSSYI